MRLVKWSIYQIEGRRGKPQYAFWDEQLPVVLTADQWKKIKRIFKKAKVLKITEAK